ncbi:MAG: hypothetical protein N2B03_09735 [Boseongicola sp.]
MKILTATIAVLAIAGSLVAPAPARADGDDIAKAIAGIAAIAIIAKALDRRKDRDNLTTIGSRRLGSVERYDGRRTIDGTIRRYDNKRGPKARRGYKKHALPRSCLRVVDTSRGDRLVYGARCVNRNFKFASKLPERCETAVRTGRGYRTVYGARCLRRDGWKVARR